ncbi:MAG: TatD family hydrolase [bacterium]|nr:TatD family hydrolase [bacterium]
MGSDVGLADVHAHLTHPRLLPDADAIVARAQAAGVTTIVCNGLNPTDNAAVLALAAHHPAIKPGLGLYPVDAVLPELLAIGKDYPRDAEPVPAEEAIAWVRARAGEALAIGEIGLDGHWVPEALWPRQEEVFRAMVRIALDADRPIIVHTRKRERRTLEILDEMGVTRVDWHCFGGKVSLARQIAARGHWMSVPANARRSESFTRMLQTLPREKLLFETDCPYLGPERDAGSEPAHVAGTAAYAAELWGVSVEEVAERTSESFAALFRVTP